MLPGLQGPPRQQPLTIGNYPNVKALELTEPISDILASTRIHVERQREPCRPIQDGFEGYLTIAWRSPSATGKELIANATVWGARDDATHVEVSATRWPS